MGELKLGNVVDNDAAADDDATDDDEFLDRFFPFLLFLKCSSYIFAKLVNSCLLSDII